MAIYALIETCKLNGVDPFTYLRDIFARIADHPINRIDKLLPWHWAAPADLDAAGLIEQQPRQPIRATNGRLRISGVTAS